MASLKMYFLGRGMEGEIVLSKGKISYYNLIESIVEACGINSANVKLNKTLFWEVHLNLDVDHSISAIYDATKWAQE